MTSLRLAVLATLLGVVSSSSMVVLSPIPSSISLPAGATLKASSLSKFNSGLLGLAEFSDFATSSSLFRRPKAIVAVELWGVPAGSVSVDGDTVELTSGHGSSWHKGVERQIGKQFDATEYVDEAKMKAAAQGEKVDTSKLKSKGEVAGELEKALQLAAAIKHNGDNFATMAGPAVFSVHINKASEAAPSDLLYAINQLAAAGRAVYGDDGVVVEVIQWDEHHARGKREATDTHPVMKARQALHVMVFSGSDYPAIFAIFAGLVIILVLAILYIAVGLWNMDPGKDSIIYRMTTTRMKKD